MVFITSGTANAAAHAAGSAAPTSFNPYGQPPYPRYGLPAQLVAELCRKFPEQAGIVQELARLLHSIEVRAPTYLEHERGVAAPAPQDLPDYVVTHKNGPWTTNIAYATAPPFDLQPNPALNDIKKWYVVTSGKFFGVFSSNPRAREATEGTTGQMKTEFSQQAGCDRFNGLRVFCHRA